MRIVVSIKQVPETTEVKIDQAAGRVDTEGLTRIINPYDTYALEEAIRIKENSGATVAVITVGTAKADESLREALAMGADEAFLLCDEAFEGSDPLATAYVLARGIEKCGPYDLIICGRQAMDGASGQVGPSLAEELGLPMVTFVRKIEELRDGYIRVQRMTDDGYEVLEGPLPMLITVVKEINEPRLASLKGLMKAKRVTIPVWGAGDIGADPARIGATGSPTRVVRLAPPPPRTGGEMIEGTPQEQVEKLVAKLKAAKVL
ncbi:MAG: electron transfer flavoprotein subunit beta/FixA family protein [Firmicutes bacterium]|nr:electron transfer flavoprotein subunit beta/FixA family protein [Bacillota bacterium]